MSKKLDAALEYLGRGWSVIPVHPSKKTPLDKWKAFQRRLPTPEEVEKWWTAWPNAQIGIVTGSVSGLIVLDIDGDEGKESVKDIHIEPTLRVKTKKGEHYYFKHPGGSLANFARKMPGVDARADGGFVVAPPSTGYEWIIGPDVAEAGTAPDWFLALFEKKSKNKEGWMTELMSAPPVEGERNDTLTKLAGGWVAQGKTPQEVMLLAVGYSSGMNPPLEPDEVAKIVKSVFDSHARNHGTDEDNRQAALVQLSEDFGFPIQAVLKYKMTDPIYEIHIEGALEPVRVKTPVLLSQPQLRVKMVAITNRAFPTANRQKWDQIVRAFLNAVEEIDMGEEATEEGITRSWLDTYLETGDGVAKGDAWSQAALNNEPFEKESQTYFSLSDLRAFVGKMGSRHTEQELAARLKAIGCTKTVININTSGIRKQKKVWSTPGRLRAVASGE